MTCIFLRCAAAMGLFLRLLELHAPCFGASFLLRQCLMRFTLSGSKQEFALTLQPLTNTPPGCSYNAENELLWFTRSPSEFAGAQCHCLLCLHQKWEEDTVGMAFLRLLISIVTRKTMQIHRRRCWFAAKKTVPFTWSWTTVFSPLVVCTTLHTGKLTLLLKFSLRTVIELDFRMHKVAQVATPLRAWTILFLKKMTLISGHVSLL